MSNADEIIRNAVALDAAGREQDEREAEQAVAVAAAREVGVSDRALSGALVGGEGSRSRPLAIRVIPAPLDHASAHVSALLQGYGFERVSTAAGVEIWNRTEALRKSEGSDLRWVQHLEVRYRPEADNRTAVALVGTFAPGAKNERTARFMLNAFTSIFLGMILVFSPPGGLLLLALAAALVANTVYAGIQYRALKNPADKVLDRALDEVQLRALASHGAASLPPGRG